MKLLTTLMFAAVILLASITHSPLVAQDDDQPEFARQTVDLGIVVSDLDQSTEFYTKAIGFQETGGFGVPADFATDAGLTNGVPLEVAVLTLGDEETATRLKLMQVADVESKTGDNRFIHSQLGFSYLTIMVVDTEAALARLKAMDVKPVAKGPVELPESLATGVFLTVVRDPDGNLVELVGPKK